MITSFTAACVEAWQELRIHKLRVLLSLIGVGVAVCALTVVVALGDMMSQGLRETFERESGRPATYTMEVFFETAASPGYTAVRTAADEALERSGIRYASVNSPTSIDDAVPADGGIAAGTGMESFELGAFTQVFVVDPDYAVIHRQRVTAGRWFTAEDAQNLSPPIVVDQLFLDRRGLSAAQLPVTTELPGSGGMTATIIGVGPAPYASDQPAMFLLSQTAAQVPELAANLEYVSLEMWLPEEISEELAQQVAADVARALPDAEVSVWRTDYAAWGEDPVALGGLRTALLGISGLILLLGALGLMNIALVTIQQRIREIGIRRSFGATGGRIFFSVMMESVVATAVAGGVGVLAAMLILKSPRVTAELERVVMDAPPFPLSAALLGLVVSVGVGALAGLVPAVLATRVRIVDAIRS